MARPSKPWLRTDTGKWYVTIRGVLHDLGTDRDQALRAFHALMAGGAGLPTPPALPGDGVPPPPSPVTFRGLVDRYLEARRGRVAEDTWRVAKAYLAGVSLALGDRDAGTLARADVERAVGGHPGWNPTTQNHVYGRLAALFGWALSEGLLDRSPVAGIRRPRRRRRGAEVLPSADQVETLLAAARPALRAVLVCLFDTGCRPGEAIRVEARDLRADARVWVLAAHKTAHATGRPRVVHLTDRVLAMSVERAAVYPTGPLFRTTRGVPWGKAKRISEGFRALRRRVGLPEDLVPYGMRHAFASEALAGGETEAVVAALLGHASTRMVSETYGHVGDMAKVMRDALGRVRKSA